MNEDDNDDNWVALDLSGADNEEAEKVTIEVEGQEEEQEPTILVEAEKEVEVEEPAPEPEEPKELEGIETKGAQKRIRQLVKQKKERDAEIEKMRQELASIKEQSANQQKQLSSSLKTNIDSTDESLTSQIAVAKDTIRMATENGDIEKQLEAQEVLAQANARKVQLEQQRQAWEDYSKNAEEQYQAQVAAAQEETTPQYPQAARDWAMNNQWFGQDQIATAVALEINQDLLKEDYDPEDEEFYKEVTNRLATRYPDRFGKSDSEPANEEVEEKKPVPKASTKQPSQVVGGASRTPKTSGSSNSVKISAEERAVAEKMGVTLEQYAINKLRTEQADGEYLEVL